MRVVVDTNVFVSSFWGGKPMEVIQHWYDGQVTLCLNQAILEEYHRVLEKMGLENEEELKSIFSMLKSGKNLDYCVGSIFRKFIAADPDDDKFINCALELGANTIVSGDKHLLGASRVFDIEIVKPSDFLKKFP